MDQAKHTAVGQFLSRIVEEFGQAERGVGEVQRPVRPVNEVVRAIEPLPFVAVSQYRQDAVLLETRHPTIAVFVDREATLSVQGQSIRAGLGVFADVRSGVTAMRAVDGDFS